MNQKWHCSGRVCSTTLNYHCKLLSTNALALNTLQSKLCNVLSAAHTLSNTEMSGKCLLMNFRQYSPGSNKFIKHRFWSQPSSALTFPLSPTQQQTCFKLNLSLFAAIVQHFLRFTDKRAFSDKFNGHSNICLVIAWPTNWTEIILEKQTNDVMTHIDTIS